MNTAARLLFAYAFLSLTYSPIATLHAQESAAPQAAGPNVVFIFIDDMGFGDPSCFGNTIVKTPNIDRLADEGIRLTNFYVNSPICSASRTAVTTGQYPHRWRIFSYLASREANHSRGMADYLDPNAPSFARFFQQAGYATAHFGKWHMGGGRDVGEAPLPTEYGFDKSLVSFEGLGDRLLWGGGLCDQSEQLGRGTITKVEKCETTGIYVDHAIDFIRRNREQPFFVRMFPNDVHDAHVPKQGSELKWAEATDNPFEQKFFAVLENMDLQIGRLLNELDRLDLTDRTLVVFTSDNGPTDWPSYRQKGWEPPGFTGGYFGRKWSLYEGGIRMPFVARLPGVIPKNTTNDTSVMCAIDLAPTLCAMAGVTVPDDIRLDGLDMSDALRGKPIERSEPVYWQYGAPHARLKPGTPEFVSPTLAVRDGDWKLLANPDGSGAHLFNLKDDPYETTNLLEQYPERAAQLWSGIKQWANGLDEFDFEITTDQLKPGVELLQIEIDGQMRAVEKLRVDVTENAEGKQQFYFAKGESWLDLPREPAPSLADKTIRMSATVKPEQPNGVIIAHGGNRQGYSLYLKAGCPTFSLCNDWEQTIIAAENPIEDGEHKISATLSTDGLMTLAVDDKQVAQGKAAGPLKTSPGDSLQIGADLIQPAGDYKVPFSFRGTIRDIVVEYGG